MEQNDHSTGPSKVPPVVRMGTFPVTAASSSGTTLTCNAGFCKLGATLGRVEGTTHGGGGDKEGLMALLPQRVQNKRMRQFFQFPPPPKGCSSAGRSVHKHNNTKTVDKRGGSGGAVWSGVISG